MTRVYALTGIGEQRDLELLGIIPVPADAVTYAKSRLPGFDHILIAYTDGEVHMLHRTGSQRAPIEELNTYAVNDELVRALHVQIEALGPLCVLRSLIQALQS